MKKKAKRTQRQLDNTLRVVAMSNRDAEDMLAAYRKIARREPPLGVLYGCLDELKAQGLVRETQGRKAPQRYGEMCYVKWALTPAGRKKVSLMEAAAKKKARRKKAVTRGYVTSFGHTEDHKLFAQGYGDRWIKRLTLAAAKKDAAEYPATAGKMIIYKLVPVETKGR